MVTGGLYGETGPSRVVPAAAAVIAILSIVALWISWPGMMESFTVHMVFHIVLYGVLAPMLLICRFFPLVASREPASESR